MQDYINELEHLITDTLLPAYEEHCRLLNRPDMLKLVRSDLVKSLKRKRQVPAILQRQKYG